jgi:hypothetical protein
MWTKQVQAQAAFTALLSNIPKAPQAISPAIGFSTFDLRRFFPPVATPAITIGLIYLIIIAFFSFTSYLPHHMKFISCHGHRPLKFPQYIYGAGLRRQPHTSSYRGRIRLPLWLSRFLSHHHRDRTRGLLNQPINITTQVLSCIRWSIR